MRERRISTRERFTVTRLLQPSADGLSGKKGESPAPCSGASTATSPGTIHPKCPRPAAGHPRLHPRVCLPGPALPAGAHPEAQEGFRPVRGRDRAPREASGRKASVFRAARHRVLRWPSLLRSNPGFSSGLLAYRNGGAPFPGKRLPGMERGRSGWPADRFFCQSR